MTEQLEALVTLAKSGTMASAALKLRVSASAISKRIALLEEQVGYRLIEPRGRRVELTPGGLQLAARAEPVLRGLRDLLTDETVAQTIAPPELSLAVTESVLSSWGPFVLARAKKFCPNLRLALHAHRSPVVLERVRSGEVTLGICAGLGKTSNDLRVDLLFEEPMVIVAGQRDRIRLARGTSLEVMSIETHAITWQSLAPQLRKLTQESGVQLQITRHLQSFSCIVQLATAGFGPGLVPAGIASAMAAKRVSPLPVPGLTRPVCLVARESSYARKLVQEFRKALVSACQAVKI